MDFVQPDCRDDLANLGFRFRCPTVPFTRRACGDASAPMVCGTKPALRLLERHKYPISGGRWNFEF